jgi:putative transcriptional regulator
MAIVRKSLSQIRLDRPALDRTKIVSASERDIRRHQIEDGEDPDAPTPAFAENVVRAARGKLELTQEQFAELTKIPIATLRNWEQGRTEPDAAARAFFRVVMRIPAQAKKALEEEAA